MHSLVPAPQRPLCLWSGRHVSCTLKHHLLIATVHRPNSKSQGKLWFLLIQKRLEGLLQKRAEFRNVINKWGVRISLQT